MGIIGTSPHAHLQLFCESSDITHVPCLIPLWITSPLDLAILQLDLCDVLPRDHDQTHEAARHWLLCLFFVYSGQSPFCYGRDRLFERVAILGSLGEDDVTLLQES